MKFYSGGAKIANAIGHQGQREGQRKKVGNRAWAQLHKTPVTTTGIRTSYFEALWCPHLYFYRKSNT